VRERYCVGGFAVAGIIDSRGTDPAGLRIVAGGGTGLVAPLEMEGIDSWLELGFCAAASMTAVIFLCWCEMKDPNKGVEMIEPVLGFDDFLAPSAWALNARLRVSAAPPPSAELNVALLIEGRSI